MSVRIRAWRPLAAARVARSVIAAGGMLALGVAAVGSPAAAASAASHAMTQATPAPLPVFRVDVSRYPQVGLVVTVPRGGHRLTSGSFTVMAGSTPVRPSVRRLSASDIQLALAPDTAGSASVLAAERAAAADFTVGLPRGARTVIVDPSRPAISAGGLTADPAASVARIAALAPGPAQPAGTRLLTALSAFSPGPRVRRTVVLVVCSDERRGRAAALRFRRQLAASGTALYVLDASRRGSATYDALAAASGGFAARLRAPGDWPAAFSRIVADLGSQYYLRFRDPAPLPGMAVVAVATPTGQRRSGARLPAVNPIAPPPAALEPPTAQVLKDRPLVGLSILLIILVLCYGLGMLIASRRDPQRLAAARRSAQAAASSADPPRGDLFFVFLLPCLNEEKVIRGSLQRLLSIPAGNFTILVIDDDSDDNTVAVATSVLGDQAWLLRRTAPHARQGKGEALNAAIRYLTGSGLLDGRDPNEVIVVVVDADGRLDLDAVAKVSPFFADPTVGAVQIGVRINNRAASRLARMQDMEFVLYTEIFQRGRRHLGSVGLGGNGQFMRLAALRSLGAAPWTRSLTEDLDLGIRLLAAGWRNEYCSAAAVHQQGVVELRRLIRQRSRWFQGHLQSWKLIPTVLRSAPRRARADLLYHLSSPAILLIASLLSASFLLAVADYAVIAARGGDPLGWWLASTYALTFGPALIFSSVYWTRERHSGVPMIKIAGFAHLYVGYSLMWYAAGWWAVGRTVRRRTGWVKTDRVAEAPAMVSAAASGALAGGPQLSEQQPSGQQPSGQQPSGQQPSGRQPSGRQRVRAFALASVVVLTCAVLGTVTPSIGERTTSAWFSVFNGHGMTSVAGSGIQQVITLSPRRALTRRDTHAALMLTKSWYQDFVAIADVLTVHQLRRGAAGRPNPWEVGWIIWHYTSNSHFYALTLEPDGWVLSKQDPAYRGDERFLASANFPRFRVGVTHSVGIVQIGNQITVSADGRRLAQFTDTQRPYLSGGFGVYTEDSVVRFAGIRLSPLPSIRAPFRRHASAHPSPAISR